MDATFRSTSGKRTESEFPHWRCHSNGPHSVLEEFIYVSQHILHQRSSPFTDGQHKNIKLSSVPCDTKRKPNWVKFPDVSEVILGMLVTVEMQWHLSFLDSEAVCLSLGVRVF